MTASRSTPTCFFKWVPVSQQLAIQMSNSMVSRRRRERKGERHHLMKESISLQVSCCTRLCLIAGNTKFFLVVIIFQVSTWDTSPAGSAEVCFCLEKAPRHFSFLSFSGATCCLLSFPQGPAGDPGVPGPPGIMGLPGYKGHKVSGGAHTHTHTGADCAWLFMKILCGLMND